MSLFTQKPVEGDFPGYFQSYIALVPEADLLQLLETQLSDWVECASSWTDEQWMLRYAPEKWTVKEVMGHIVDTERIMAYRALCISRGENKNLPGFDDEVYVQQAQFNARPGMSIMEEWQTLRTSNLHLFASFTLEQCKNFGAANGLRINLRAIPYIIYGHAMHHMDILNSRYGISLKYV